MKSVTLSNNAKLKRAARRTFARARSTRIRDDREKRLFYFLFFCFAIAISVLIDGQSRNYLPITACIVSIIALPILRLKINSDWMLTGIFVVHVVIMNTIYRDSNNILSGLLTITYLFGYLITAGLAQKKWFTLDSVLWMLAFLVKAFAAVSILQLFASLVGAPIPNEIASKGLWSYNSLAFEPSQLGRIVGITMLVFIILHRLRSPDASIWRIFHSNKFVIGAFLATMLLSGSALAAAAIIAVFVLAWRVRWGPVIGLLLLIAWPFLVQIDYEPLQRVINLVGSLPSNDIDSIHKADGSGAIRIVPVLIYIEASDFQELQWWLGYGQDGLTKYFLGKVPTVSGFVAAGFLPGFAVFYGMFGLVLFLWAFLLRFVSRTTAPIIVFWLAFFSFSAWNTQVFWFGLICVRVAYEAERRKYGSCGGSI